MNKIVQERLHQFKHIGNGNIYLSISPKLQALLIIRGSPQLIDHPIFLTS
jgi:hypothetical protein